MKVSLSVEHNGEYIPIDTHKGIPIPHLEQVSQFIETLKDGEIRNVRIDYPDRYYTFKGEIKKETGNIKIIIKNEPAEHIKE